jgi:hypothetical protein
MLAERGRCCRRSSMSETFANALEVAQIFRHNALPVLRLSSPVFAVAAGKERLGKASEPQQGLHSRRAGPRVDLARYMELLPAESDT